MKRLGILFGRVFLLMLVILLLLLPMTALAQAIPGLEQYPRNAAMLFTSAGVIVFAVLVTQWLKAYLKDWRFTGLLCLGIAVVAEFVAGYIVNKRMSLEIAAVAILLGFLGASVATFGYETVVNLLGKAGVGPRSDNALAAQARSLLKKP